jgi:ATP-dependent RNA helicase DHX8/PRP22
MSDQITCLTSQFWSLSDPDLTSMIISLAETSTSPSELLEKLTEAGADSNLAEAGSFFAAVQSQRPVKHVTLSEVPQSKPIYGTFTGLTLPLSSAVADQDEQQLFELQQLRRSVPTGAHPPLHAATHAMTSASGHEASVDIIPISLVPSFLKEGALECLPRETFDDSLPVSMSAIDTCVWRIKGPLIAQRQALPIYPYRQSLVETVRDNPVTVLIGETGSGKSTQLPQYLVESGMFRTVCVTQPRRVAATSVAGRVAEEQGVRLGESVGFCVRFEEQSSQTTRIMYMTDGMLLQKLQRSGDVEYDVVVLDEIHERSVNTDVLMALLKQCIFVQKRLRLVVTSATLEAEKFAQYFRGAPVLRIPGRTFSVHTKFSRVVVDDHVVRSVVVCGNLLEDMYAKFASCAEPNENCLGHVLIFLSGQEEIERCAILLRDKVKEIKIQVDISVLYASLSNEQQRDVFRKVPKNTVKVVISTNVAEASVTVEGVVNVIDSGKVKVKRYDEKTMKSGLAVEWVSQASGEQRKGRAGRTRPGVCYRLFSEEQFKSFANQTVAEILRSDLSGVVLKLKSLGVKNVMEFDFMERPKTMLLVDAMKRLFSLGALDTEGELTELGRMLSKFPLEPEMSKVLLASVDLGCVEEAAIVLGFLSEGGVVFERPDVGSRMYEVAMSKHREFFNLKWGDLVTYLELYGRFVKAGKSKQWCTERFLNFRVLMRVEKIKAQLIDMVTRLTGQRGTHQVTSARGDYAKLAKALCAGYFNNAVVRRGEAGSSGLKLVRDESEVFIHPSSVLVERAPKFFIFTELVITSREYVRNACVIDPKWLPECAPSCFREAEQSERLGDKRKLNPIGVKKGEEDSWRLKKRLGY